MARKILHLESALMGGALVAVILGGLYFVFAETAGKPGPREVNHNVKRYDEKSLHHVSKDLLSHKAVSSFKTQHKSVWSIAVTKKGIFVSGNDGVHHYDEDGELLGKMESGKSVRYVGPGDDDKLLMCQGDKVLLYKSDGTFLKALSHAKVLRPNAVVERDGSFYVADRASRMILKLNGEGEPQTTFGHMGTDTVNNFVIPGPHMDLSFSPEGLLFATNPGRHQVKAYSTDGKLVKVMGKPSFRHDGFCGCCNPVAMTVLGDGTVVTTEKGICRVKAINQEGIFESIVAPPVDFRANKHAFMIDVVEGPEGKIYLLNSETREVHIYSKKEKGHA